LCFPAFALGCCASVGYVNIGPTSTSLGDLCAVFRGVYVERAVVLSVECASEFIVSTLSVFQSGPTRN